MYVPAAFAMADRVELLAFLRDVAFGHLVTHGTTAHGPGLSSTPLPFVIDDELTTLRAHFARGNPHWRTVDGADALLIVPGADAYVSPRWYPSKAVDGRVVPTWNYEVVHLHGTIEVHDAADWKRRIVDDLTVHNEARASSVGHGRAWAVDDAPAEFIDQQLKAIVGFELHVTNVEAKRKLSQNKAESDQAGAADGLARSADPRDQRVGSLMTARPEPFTAKA
jgi:transcriptional regulator